MTADLNLVSNSGSVLPAVALEIAVDSALTVAEALNTRTFLDDVAPEIAALRAAIARVEALDLKGLGRRIDTAMQPATVKDVATKLARLVAGYPTKNRDPEFSTILFDEIAAAEPSLAALDAAVRHLHRSLTFLPSIAEVLEALGEAEWRLDGKRRELAKTPGRLDAARAQLKYLEQATKEEIEERRWLLRGGIAR
jgi:hypothetical protein